MPNSATTKESNGNVNVNLKSSRIDQETRDLNHAMGERQALLQLHLTKQGGFDGQDFEFYKSFPGLVSLD